MPRRSVLPVLPFLTAALGLAVAAACDGSLGPGSGGVSVAISSPAHGDTLAGVVTLTAVASSLDRQGIAGVRFRVDDTWLGPEDAASPFRAVWNTAEFANGERSVVAIARTRTGDSTSSSAVRVVLANPGNDPPDLEPPAISILTPVAGDTISGTVSVRADASDGVGVDRVRFFVDGKLLGADDAAEPWERAWNSLTWPNGAHVLTAVAQDLSGNTAASEPVGVVVRNSTGELRITVAVGGGGHSPTGIGVLVDGVRRGGVPGSGGIISLNPLVAGSYTIALELHRFCSADPQNPAVAVVIPHQTVELTLSATCPPVSTAEVSVSVGGSGTDADSISVVVDGFTEGRVSGSGGTVTFPAAVGAHVIGLGDLAYNCLPDQGLRTLQVFEGQLASIELSATCDEGLAQSIAFGSGAYWWSGWDIFRLDAPYQEPRRITEDPAADYYPAWSPDGAEIAFISTRDHDWGEIYVMNADGSGPVLRLTNDEAWDQFPVWSPDGTKILFASTTDLAVVDWHHGYHELFVVNADGTGRTKLTHRDGATQDFPGGWTPDGSRILFQRYRLDGSELSDFYTMSPDGSDVRLLLAGEDGAGFAPSWSPDGTKIVFSLYTTAPCCDMDVAVVNADGTGLTNLTNTFGEFELDPVWTRDGSRIVFVSSDGIEIMKADGSSGRTILYGGFGDEVERPTLSP
jgi:Tol biopolymer transport system component